MVTALFFCQFFLDGFFSSLDGIFFNDGWNLLKGCPIFNNVVVGPKDFCGQNLYESDNIFKSAEHQDFPGFVNAEKVIEFESIEKLRDYFSLHTFSPAMGTGVQWSIISK